MRAEEIALTGESDVTEHELVAHWHLPRFSLERDAWLVVDPADHTVGVAWTWDERPHVELVAGVNVNPGEARRAAVSAHLLARIEARAQEHRAAAGGARVVLGVAVEEVDRAKRDLLAGRGFAEMRRFYRMRIDLRRGYARPAWPAGVEARGFRRGCDEGPVHEALDEAFAEHFRYAPMALDDWERHCFARADLDTGLWLVAWDGAEVAGTCLAFVTPDRGYVDELGVRKPWRRRGLGLALLLESFARLEARGQTEVVLGVDSENTTGALSLYLRAGMEVAQTRLFLEKEILAAT